MAHRVTCRQCPRCDGEGEIYQEFVTAPPYIATGKWYECPDCGGEGVLTDELVEDAIPSASGD